MPNAARQAEIAAKQAKWDPKKTERVRRICMGYPEVVEVEQFGAPWWKAGKKPFCTYGAEDHGDGAAFNVSPMDQSELLKDPRFERTHYIGQHGWTTMRLEGNVAWDDVEELIGIAYRRVANQRMLAALGQDGTGRARTPAAAVSPSPPKNK